MYCTSQRDVLTNTCVIAVHDPTMYWTSRVDGELTSVIVRCVGEAPTHVTEQAKVAKIGKDVWGDKAEQGN